MSSLTGARLQGPSFSCANTLSLKGVGRDTYNNS